MAKYSRTQKYEELRNRIQNDTGAAIGSGSPDLSTYEDKLNRIDANTFKAPQEYTAADHDPIHQRRMQTVQETPRPVQAEPVQEVSTKKEPSFDPSILSANGFTSMLDNEYLDEYINEVKRYNKEHGAAFSTNTRSNILHDLKKTEEKPETVNVRPYREPEPVKDEGTTELPPIFAQKESRKEPAAESASHDNPYGFDLPDFPFIEDRNEPVSAASTRTKEDIAAEVQSLMQNQYQPQTQPVKEETKTVNYDYHLEEERTARQQLLNETTQMRAQLDNYEDNLEEVNDRVQRTNQVLNGVLIVLIIVLFLMLAVVVYWILNSKGVL